MAEQGFPWISRQLAVLVTEGAPLPGRSSHTGGTPRYGLYPTSDGKYVAVAALEEKFWQNFCAAIELPSPLREARADPKEIKQGIGERLAARTAEHWREVFRGDDFSVEVVVDLGQATADPQFVERNVFGRRVRMANGEEFPALPMPLVAGFLSTEADVAPRLGELTAGGGLWDEICGAGTDRGEGHHEDRSQR
jgi:alpha-methylacyl-CoA racemase